MNERRNEISEQLRACAREADALRDEARGLKQQIAVLLSYVNRSSLDGLCDVDVAKLQLHTTRFAACVEAARALRTRRAELAAELANA